MRFSLKFEQVVQDTPRFIFTELVDPRREGRVRVNSFLTRDLIRSNDWVVRSEFVSRVLRVTSRFSAEFVAVRSSLFSEPVSVVVTRETV